MARSSPTDIFRKPRPDNPAVAKLYDALKADLGVETQAESYWRVALDEADEWPYPDPDEAFTAPGPPLDDAIPPDASITYLDDPLKDPEFVLFSEDEPWGKMSNESDRQYRYFFDYRNLGIAREFKTIAKRFNVSAGHIGQVAKENRWEERVLAWDLLRERIYTKEMLMGVRQMAQEHVKIAGDGLKAMAAAFNAISRRQQRDPAGFDAELDTMPIKSLITIAQRSAQVVPSLMAAERLARNMPTELVAVQIDQKVTVSVADLTDIVKGLASSLPPRDDSGSDIVDAEVVDDEPRAIGYDSEGADPETE